MKALTVIRSAEQAGCELTADVEHISIKNGKLLPDSINPV